MTINCPLTMKKVYKVWTVVECVDIDENGVEVGFKAEVPDEVCRYDTHDKAMYVQNKIQHDFGNVQD